MPALFWGVWRGGGNFCQRCCWGDFFFCLRVWNLLLLSQPPLTRSHASWRSFCSWTFDFNSSCHSQIPVKEMRPKYYPLYYSPDAGFDRLLTNRRAFCMRMRQYGLLKGHRSIFCELFTFSTSICRLFSGAEWRVLGATFHKHVL